MLVNKMNPWLILCSNMPSFLSFSGGKQNSVVVYIIPRYWEKVNKILCSVVIHFYRYCNWWTISVLAA